MSYVGRIDVEKQEISACEVSIIDISAGGGGGYINYDRITVFHIGFAQLVTCAIQQIMFSM